MDLSHSRLKELLHYDPITGFFTWISKPASRANRVKVGSRAGQQGARYWRIGVDGKIYTAHRLAWFYMTGAWPENTVDHWSTDKTDNSWGNLREATQQEQTWNSADGPNVTGYRGVSPHYGKFMAKMYIAGKQTYLGVYSTPEEASQVYEERRMALHGAFYKPPTYNKKIDV